MKKHLSLALLLAAAGIAGKASAFDLGNAVDKAAAAAKDPKAAAQSAGNAAGDAAAASLTKKLKAVQNEKGPIVFVKGKADLDAKKCERTLKSIDGLIKNAPGFKVTIEGHTDNTGKAEANLKLSQARAEAVVKWLTEHLQTPADRMVAKGFGDTQPIADNKTAKGRAKNRRVDFSVSKL
jgi:outer membrane protein OmpA-like peptidoglycan-associated protein